MSNVLADFFVKLGFSIDTNKLDEFQKKTEGLRASVVSLGAIATGAAAGIGLMIMGVARGMDDVGDFADIVGMTAREVDALGKIAKQNDSSMEAMQSTIQGLSAITGEAALGVGRGAMIFEKLGFAAKDAAGETKGAGDLLGEVADKLQTMNASEALALTGKLRIDPSLIPLLRQGGEEFRKLKAEAEASNPLTEQQYKQADAIVKSWNKATANVGMFTKRIGASLFPIMKQVLDTYNGFLKAGKSAFGESITASIKSFVALLAFAWDWASRLFVATKSGYDYLKQFKVVVYAAGAAVAALIAYKAGLFFIGLASAVVTVTRALFAFNVVAALPAILIGGFVIAVALLIDELVNFYEGNDSIIGQMMTDYPYALEIAWGAVVTFAAIAGAAFVALKWKAISSMVLTMRILYMYAAEYVLAQVKAAGSLAMTGLAWIAYAAVATKNAIVAGAAWLLALGPVFWLVAGVAAAAGLIYIYWDELTAFIKKAWEDPMGTLRTLTDSTINFVLDKFNFAKDRIKGFIDTVSGAIGKVGELFGLSSSSPNLQLAFNDVRASSPSSALGSSLGFAGPIGRAANGNVNTANTTTQTTTISAPITVNNPDPVKAAQEVKYEIDRLNKRATGNNQTSVGL
jgi:hypothetical protein